MNTVVNPDAGDPAGHINIIPVFGSKSMPTPPPLLPPPLPASHPPRKNRAWIIVGLCGGGVIATLVLGTLAVGTLMRTGAPGPRRSPAGAPAAAKESTGEPGISYKLDTVSSEPWSIHVLKIDRNRKDLAFFTAHARNKVLGVSFIADQARSVPREFGRAIAGVNGDFYLRDNPMYAGDPRGLQILNGELISAPDTVCVWFDPAGNPHLDDVKGDFNLAWADRPKTPFRLNERRANNAPALYTPSYGPSTRAAGGREFILEKDGDGPWLPFEASQTYHARVREIQNEGNTALAPDTLVLSYAPQLLAGLPEIAVGARVEISTATTPALTGVKMAIAGGPALIRNGTPFSATTPPPTVAGDYTQRSKYERHPRAAVGWSPTHIFLLVVDGRQPGLSVGMKLAELATYMAKLGCVDAMNLDGGKSAQMWMSGHIMNSPCQGEDTVANSLLIVRKAGAN